MIFWKMDAATRISERLGHKEDWVGNRLYYGRARLSTNDIVAICGALDEDSRGLLHPYLGGGIGEGALRFIVENCGNVTGKTMRRYYGEESRRILALLHYQRLIVREGECYLATPEGKWTLVRLDLLRAQGIDSELLSRL